MLLLSGIKLVLNDTHLNQPHEIKVSTDEASLKGFQERDTMTFSVTASSILKGRLIPTWHPLTLQKSASKAITNSLRQSHKRVLWESGKPAKKM